MDHVNAPLGGLIDELSELIETRPVRVHHYLPDLALKMLATQVLQYGRAYEYLVHGSFVSWSFPIARAAFETASDLAFLAFAPDLVEYDRRGALAHVGAEISVSNTNRKAEEAVPSISMETAISEKERIEILSQGWGAYREDAPAIVHAAYDEARAARHRRKHWTLLSRRETHEELQARLGDDQFAGVFISWYDILSSRSHPGLHSPQLRRSEGGHEFLTDGDEDNPIPEASVRIALIFSSHALRHQYEIWGGSNGGDH